jgi:peptide/nickel transport system substrate-binding protein
VPERSFKIKLSRNEGYAFLSAAALLFCLFSGCTRTGGEDRNKTVFRYNEAAGITSLDPAFARDQANIWATHQVFNGLIQLDDNLRILPCIARWWTISGDGKEYRFRLRRDVSFHDDPAFPGGIGRKVVAKDFVYSFTRILEPRTASPGAWIFSEVEPNGGSPSFFAPDDSTLVIRLKKSFPPFLGLLTTMYGSVVPREAIRKYGQDFRRNPVGTGPFRFGYWKEGVKLVLVKNPSYFETVNGHRLPYLDAVAITFLADKQSAFLEFVKGRLDFMSGIDPGYKDEVLTRDGSLREKFRDRFRLVTCPYLNTEYLGFLMDPSSPVIKNDPVRLKKIRMAINHSFDRRKMIRFLRNNIGIPGIYGIVPPGMPSFDSTAVYYDYDPGLARRLLEEAGFPAGSGLPPVTLSTTSDYLDICKYIQNRAGELGIEMKIDISPPAALKEMKAQARLPFFRASWIADYPDGENYLSLFYSRNFCPAGPNYTRFSSPEFDRLYELSMSTTDDSLRIACYRRMEKIMMQEAPVVVLYYDLVLRFVGNNISGLGCDPMNLLTLKNVRKRNW